LAAQLEAIAANGLQTSVRQIDVRKGR
jgi:hypothetical protein